VALDFVFLIGGEAGQGIQSTGQILAKAIAKNGFYIFADQDFESRIRGGHNFFRIRASDKPVQAISEKLDFIIALNAETLNLHQTELKTNGVIIHDSKSTAKLSGGLNYFGIPFEKLAVKEAGNRIMRNTVALGATTAFVQSDLKTLESVLKRSFRSKGEEIINSNLTAARVGYKYVSDQFKENFSRALVSKQKSSNMLLSGVEAVALGALASDCKFMSGYPMTPSSGILHYFASKSEEMGVVFEHAEDEIAALNMAIGASYAGVRAMTATSGGGFSLMVEALSLSGMTETPVVIVLGQRPGPATGLPTRTEQGELSFAIHAGHGMFPRAVFAPSTAEESFYLTVKAFNLAEKYQIPVILLTDQYLSDSYTTLQKFDLSHVKIDRGKFVSEKELAKIGKYKYMRHKLTPSGVSVRALPGTKNALVVTDSDEHTQEGHITESAKVRNEMVKKRLRKLEGLRKEISSPKTFGPIKATTVLVSWGSTFGALKEAVEMLNSQGGSVRMIHFSEIWPFPTKAFMDQLKNFKELIVVESNATGQMKSLIASETGLTGQKKLLRYDGRPLTPKYIIENLNGGTL
jgi:2-oxoglutarate ferredoxin oxidoreductase subunit alpha